MNVRFAKNQIRFRFKEKELLQLQQDDALTLKITLPMQQNLQFHVKQISGIQKPQCEYHQGIFIIDLSEEIATLLLQEPSREGIEFPWIIEGIDHTEVMIVQLQCDLR